MLKRNCSVTPSQLGWAYGALCVTSLGIGAWFWAMAGDTSLIEVSGQGRKVKVGRYVRPELRPALAHEIRTALRQA